jgi:hypothetical protein
MGVSDEKEYSYLFVVLDDGDALANARNNRSHAKLKPQKFEIMFWQYSHNRWLIRPTFQILPPRLHQTVRLPSCRQLRCLVYVFSKPLHPIPPSGSGTT